MIIPVILSGGAGTRLWPVSREGHPKPFMRLADGQSLLLKTYLRAAAVIDALGAKTGGEIITVTNRNYYFMSKDELAKAHLADSQRGVFLLEPLSRNTAPAIAMAAHYIAQHHGPDTMMLVLAADHLIENQQSFIDAVANAIKLAEQNWLVTFGVVPTGPETGFGYIEAGAALEHGYQVKRFVEKPTQEKAIQYIASGNFFWNSGMFCFKAGFILEQIAQYQSKLSQQLHACWAATQENQSLGAGMLEIASAPSFLSLPDISIDYAVMECSNRVAVVHSNFDWNDIGSWNAIKALVPAGEANNRTLGESIFVESSNNFVQSEDRLVATIGVDNLMIVDTVDALLIAHIDKAQDVKKVVSQLKKRDHPTYKLHRTVLRPWGTYTILGEGNGFKIKRIEVKPGASLSLQKHLHRSEHWVVVSGVAKVINGEQEIMIHINESTYIPAGHKHRLTNVGGSELVMIEVQSGSYLGEDDIIRFEDNYGRI